MLNIKEIGERLIETEGWSRDHELRLRALQAKLGIDLAGDDTAPKSGYKVSQEMIDAGAKALAPLLPEEFSFSSAECFAETAIRAALEQKDQKETALRTP